MSQNPQPTKDTYYRFVFANGIAVGKAFVRIYGDTKQGYTSALEIIPTRDFSTANPDTANKILADVVKDKYPDLCALETFFNKNSELDPESLTFKNACARVGLSPPPIFDENRGIYLRQDWYSVPAKPGDSVRDDLLTANARNSFAEENHSFSADFPVLKTGSTHYFDL